jgi:CYTH domain-containing protein
MGLKKQDMEEQIQSIYQRRFLVEGLPETRSPADTHLQIFDNYIEGTGLRLRKTRLPDNDERTFLIEKVFYSDEANEKRHGTAIHLKRSEYEALDDLRGRETRKNRYQVSMEGKELAVDVFLGNLWGLNIAKIRFNTKEESRLFEAPDEFLLDVTGDEFFLESNLVDIGFDDIRNHLAQKKEAS